MAYTLYYWPGIQGRGEFIRLALEQGGATYTDTALIPEAEGGGIPAGLKVLQSTGIKRPPFAAPILKAGKHYIAQTANILLYLGGRLKLAPADEMGKLWAHQLQLTMADFYLEIFHTHHPLSDGYAYEEQKAAAKLRTTYFLKERLPKFLGYFERVVERNPGRSPWMIGRRVSYPDLSMAHIIDGLGYAFPSASRKALKSRPRLRALYDAVFALPRIAQYATSGRRLAFNNHDIFRRYPELDRP